MQLSRGPPPVQRAQWVLRENPDVLTGGVAEMADSNRVLPWATFWSVEWAAGFPSTESCCSDSGLGLGLFAGAMLTW